MRVLRLLFMASIREFTRPSMAAMDRQRAKPTPRIETMMAIVSVFIDLSYHVTALGQGFPGCYRSPNPEKVQHRVKRAFFVVRKGPKFAPGRFGDTWARWRPVNRSLPHTAHDRRCHGESTHGNYRPDSGLPDGDDWLGRASRVGRIGRKNGEAIQTSRLLRHQGKLSNCTPYVSCEQVHW